MRDLVNVNEKVENIMRKVQSIIAENVKEDYQLFLFGSRANAAGINQIPKIEVAQIMIFHTHLITLYSSPLK